MSSNEPPKLLNWQAIWRTLIVLTPIALVLHIAGASARNQGISIPSEAISAGVGVLGVFVLTRMIRRMETDRPEEPPSHES